MVKVSMMCLTTKQTFEVDDPPVVLLGKVKKSYAYRAKCPWPGKEGRELFAYKFCSKAEYERYLNSNEIPKESADEPGES